MKTWFWVYLGKTFETIRTMAYVAIVITSFAVIKVFAQWLCNEGTMSSNTFMEMIVTVLAVFVLFLTVIKTSETIIKEARLETMNHVSKWYDGWGCVSRIISVIIGMFIWYALLIIGGLTVANLCAHAFI